jgi:pentatricopeptide repeat domain-containing protein 1
MFVTRWRTSLVHSLKLSTSRYIKHRKIFELQQHQTKTNLKAKLRELLDQDLDAARSFFDSIPTHSIEPVMVNHLIIAYTNAERFEETVELMKKMAKVDKLQLEVLLINNAINVCVKAGDMAQAQHLFDAMVDMKLKPDNITFNTLIHGYFRAQHFEQGFFLLQKMKKFQLQPQCDTFSAIIHGLGVSGNIVLAEQVFHKMLPKFNLKPSDDIIGALLDAYIKNNKHAKAIQFFENLPNEQKTVSGYNNLIQLFFRKNDAKNATRMYKNMKEMKVCPSRVTVLELISGYTNLRMYDKAIATYKEMNMSGLTELDLKTQNALLYCYCKSRDIISAGDLFAIMKKKDEYTYTTMIDGYFRNGEIEYGECIFEMMIEKGIKASGFEINAMINGYVKARKMDKAMELLKKMGSYDVTPTIYSFTPIIKGLFDQRNFNDGEELVWNMILRHKVEPNNYLWSIMISGYLRADNKSRLQDMQQQLKNAGIVMDIQQNYPETVIK